MDSETIPCRRGGCPFPRSHRKNREGRITRSHHCSHYCVVWDARAKLALREKNGDEANELLRLAVKLDARTHPNQSVTGVLVDTRQKAT